MKTITNLKDFCPKTTIVIDGDASFKNYPEITDLGNLKEIKGNADFRNSKIQSLGNLQTIGGGADFGERTDLEAKWKKRINEKSNSDMSIPEKTFQNTDSDGAKKNVSDIQFWGDGDTFKLISKAWSKKEGWMKSTKAMEIKGVGCVIQVTTQQGSNVAEAVTFAPNCRIKEETDAEGKVIKRTIIGNLISD